MSESFQDTDLFKMFEVLSENTDELKQFMDSAEYREQFYDNFTLDNYDEKETIERLVESIKSGNSDQSEVTNALESSLNKMLEDFNSQYGFCC